MSTDSRFVHKIWQEAGAVQDGEGRRAVPHVVGCRRQVGRIYGVYDEAAGVDIRGRFIIDPDFVIRAMEALTPEVGRNPEGASVSFVQPEAES